MTSLSRDIDARFLEAQDALSIPGRVGRACALATWARDLIERQIISQEGPLPPPALKLKVALRLYGSDPASRSLIERALRHASRRDIPPIPCPPAWDPLAARHSLPFHLTGGIASAEAEGFMVDAAASKLIWSSKGSHKSRRDLRHISRSLDDAERQELSTFARIRGLDALLAEIPAEPDETTG